jgi:hypothetical protein
MADTLPGKTERVAAISFQTHGCQRERVFKPGDPQRDCHLGLDSLDMRLCKFCTWFEVYAQKQIAVIGGAGIPKLLTAMKLAQADGEPAIKAETAEVPGG